MCVTNTTSGDLILCSRRRMTVAPQGSGLWFLLRATLKPTLIVFQSGWLCT